MTRLRGFAATAQQARPWRSAAMARRAWLRLLIAAGVVMGASSRVLACPQCFGAEETTMVGATQLGILVLLAVTLAVLGAFAGFFLYLRNRAKRFAAFESATDWSDLQRASRTTS